MTDVALDLRQLIVSGSLGTDWTTEKSITFKIGLYGRERVLEPYLQELENKTELALSWESKGKRWGERSRYRILVRDETKQRAGDGAGINPKINVQLDEFRKQDRDAVLELVYSQLLKAQPRGMEPFILVSVSTRAELSKCFPKFRSGQELAQFFHDLPIEGSLAKSFDFRDNAKRWFVSFHPKKDWETSLAAIQTELSRPGLAQRYGISPDADKLLTWIEALPADRFTGPWTPIVEEANDRWIGISCPWSKENFPAYLQMLIDEIKQHAGYDLALQPWHQHGTIKSRIRVARKPPAIEKLAKQLQLLALERGGLVDFATARDAIEDLIRTAENLPNGRPEA